jgi:tetratricopeptide (TPR) repeat protein
MRMGRLDDAITKYKEALEAKSDFLTSRFGLAYLFCLKEDYGAAEEQIAKILAEASFQGMKAEGYFIRGFVRLLRGTYILALQDLRTSAQTAHTAGNAQLEALAFWTEGWIHYELGALEKSNTCFDRWYELSLSDNPTAMPRRQIRLCFARGLLGLKAAKIEAARSKLLELRSILPQADQPDRSSAEFMNSLLSSEVLLASDSTEQAIVGFQKTTPPTIPNLSAIETGYYSIPFIRDGLARAYLLGGRLSEAISEYERLTTFDPRSPDRRPNPPKYHYQLARLYEQKGMKEKALQQYRRFIDLWKDADRNLPELVDARRRLRELAQTTKSR